MKKTKKLFSISVLALAMMASSITSFAYETPAEILANLTGKTSETIVNQSKNTNKSFGTIANEAGVLDNFKLESVKLKQEVLDKQVDNGTLTQVVADKILEQIKVNIANCNGTCNGACIGNNICNGTGICNGNNVCNGTGICNGLGQNEVCNGTGSCNGVANGNNNGICNNNNSNCNGTGIANRNNSNNGNNNGNRNNSNNNNNNFVNGGHHASGHHGGRHC